MSAEYSLAMSEVLCIINQSDDTYKNKIPHSFISFLKENADPTYNPNFDVTIPLKKLDLRKETKGLLALIHRSYICDEEERVEYDKILKENEEKAQRILSEKYDVYKIFENRQNQSFCGLNVITLSYNCNSAYNQPYRY